MGMSWGHHEKQSSPDIQSTSFVKRLNEVKIGPYRLENRYILAPMAGVTDRVFRQICRTYGAAMAVSEMVSSNPNLRDSTKTRTRTSLAEDLSPRSVQILGNDPAQMAECARANVQNGAQIIDINMGCPAKKVCSKAAGSALLQDPNLVESILKSVVSAVDVPVTLKIRTGWNPENRNAVLIAKIAENSGIQALTVHGRTRACGFSGMAEYRTIAEVKNAVEIPVIANGDIDTPFKATQVLEETNADAVMIGRAALGRPWIFRAMLINDLASNTMPNPSNQELEGLILNHLEALYGLYGSFMGIRIARKHVHWYSNHIPSIAAVRGRFNEASTPTEQHAILQTAFRLNPQ